MFWPFLNLTLIPAHSLTCTSKTRVHLILTFYKFESLVWKNQIYKSRELKISFCIYLSYVVLFASRIYFILTRTSCSSKGGKFMPLDKDNWVTQKVNVWDDPAIQKQTYLKSNSDLRFKFRPRFLQIPYFLHNMRNGTPYLKPKLTSHNSSVLLRSPDVNSVQRYQSFTMTGDWAK